MTDTASQPLKSAQINTAPPQRPRDLRLDFFRGLGMFIIFIAHVPGDFWALWIPARFGFSDATEIFVFCSGMASAIAFGRVFDSHGWRMGTARVIYRIWQIYWAHIALFFTIAAMLVALNASGAFDKNYVASLNLTHFFKDPTINLVGLVTLTYVPNYFDILPMYLGILLMMPIVMALSRIHLAAVVLFVGIAWLGATLHLLHLPAEPWSDRPWFFNPFGWQLVFFTGFAFMRGWLKPPPVNRTLIISAIAVILITVPFAYFRVLRMEEFEVFKQIRQEYLSVFINKTNFGIFRYFHFLALAYLCWIWAGDKGKNLVFSGSGKWVVAVIRKVGQQSLAVFITSLVLARLVGVFFDVVGRGTITVAIGNLAGFAILIATAYCVGWFKGQPWRKPAVTTPQPVRKAKAVEPVMFQASPRPAPGE